MDISGLVSFLGGCLWYQVPSERRGEYFKGGYVGEGVGMSCPEGVGMTRGGWVCPGGRWVLTPPGPRRGGWLLTPPPPPGHGIQRDTVGKWVFLLYI